MQTRKSKETYQAIKHAEQIAIGLSNPDKMPCSAYSTPAQRCQTGSKLRNVPGTPCSNCYAWMRGNYIFKNVQSALEKRYQSLTNPEWVDAMIVLIRETNKGDTRYFRWHDSGDIQSIEHLDNICKIARALPDVKFWLPTKEWKYCRDYFIRDRNPLPDNLTVRLSMPRNDQSAPQRNPDDPFTYSEVFTAGSNPSALAFQCVAHNQGNKCLDCRKCWDKDNHSTAYLEH